MWDFAAGCMRTYLILKEKAERMRDDPRSRRRCAVAKADRLAEPTGSLGGRSAPRPSTRTRSPPRATATSGSTSS